MHSGLAAQTDWGLSCANDIPPDLAHPDSHRQITSSDAPIHVQVRHGEQLPPRLRQSPSAAAPPAVGREANFIDKKPYGALARPSRAPCPKDGGAAVYQQHSRRHLHSILKMKTINELHRLSTGSARRPASSGTTPSPGTPSDLGKTHARAERGFKTNVLLGHFGHACACVRDLALCCLLP